MKKMNQSSYLLETSLHPGRVERLRSLDEITAMGRDSPLPATALAPLSI